ncbi:MAG: hypothetical protein RBR62_00400 [Bacteroidales bacterium]|jgi:hypothetical protein|nr:hypothetical protein [Bacteroidales bacterium]
MKITRKLTVFLLLVTCYGCAVLTESQVKLVNGLAVAGDSVAAAPSVLFKELAAVRTERGLLYAASLTGAQARYQEINALAQAVADDEKLGPKTDVYVTALNSYLRALRSISHPDRWKQHGTRMRAMGRNLDSLLLTFNSLDWLEEDIPMGIAKLSGKYVGYLSESYMKTRQAQAVKEFVTAGDTLVSQCVDALVVLLKKEAVNELIINEQNGLQDNYLAYLQRVENSGQLPLLENDRVYLQLKGNLAAATKVRDRCVTGLQSLKRAHNKLLKELETRQTATHSNQELIELNTIALEVQTLLNLLKVETP